MSNHAQQMPFGSWASPLTASKLVEGAAGVSEIRADGADVWWSEGRPDEGGRTQLVRRSQGGERHDLFPAFDPDAAANGGWNWNARTAVMEYGGGAWAVRGGTVLFADWDDQRLYRVDPSTGVAATPVPITPDPRTPRGLRYSEPTWIDDRWIVCVRESHEPDAIAAHGEAVTELVALPVDGSAAADPSRVVVLASGPDFLHSPAVTTTDSTTRLAWVQWDHPRMPWDGTELVVATIMRDAGGAPTGLQGATTVAGGPDESVVQPGFTSDGSLVFCTDRTGWWNPWKLPPGSTDPADASPMVRHALLDGGVDGTGPGPDGVQAEVGGALWVGGLRWWAEIAPGRLLVALTYDGATGLGVLEADGTLRELETPFTEVGNVVSVGDRHDALVVAGTPMAEVGPYVVDVMEPDGTWPVAGLEVLKPHRHLGIDSSWWSRPTHITFPSGPAGPDGHRRQAHALHYPPHNPTCKAPEGTHPPLVVMIHGGPTSTARNRLDLSRQFWTTRGFAVVDVNYGGSTGYGRAYRKLLDGAWGVVDVEDAVAAAEHLAHQGRVDGDMLAIRGGSAGGYTTLAALCFHHAFKAGASHFGIADLSALAADTHKFESRYLDGLIGPWPEARATYEARSPIHHTDGFTAPLIVLQGSEDEVVPPNQAEMIVAALANKGIPHAYLLFEGEQHGFRKAENIVRALEAELWFYGRVFGFEPADAIEPVDGAVGLG
ncbi:MAG: prolyl oligopeptidase family serine peptidase [Acidimicrobiales bacterium]